MRRLLSELVGGCLLAVEAMGACPVDPTAPAGTLLTVQMYDSVATGSPGHCKNDA